MSRVRFEGWEAEITPAGEGVHRIRIGGESREVRLLRREGGLIVFETEGRVVSAVVRVEVDSAAAGPRAAEGGRAEVIVAGRRAVFPLEDESGGGSSREGAGHGPLRAELPGTVIEVRVSEGDLVAAGDVLLVIEAMKMEHPLRAGAAGRVGRVRAEAGAQIRPGDVLLDLLPAEEQDSV
ncbi:MAG: biotin/lipoyl-containing protein [bacterium]